MSIRLVRPGGGLVLAVALVACGDSTTPVSPRAQQAQGPSLAVAPTQGMVLARATFIEPGDPVLKVKRITHGLDVDIKAKPSFDVAVQSILFPPNSSSGWHSHPGPVFILVKSGEVAFFESDDPTCTPIIRKAGEGFMDIGDHAHLARNLTGAPAENIVTYLVPPGVTALRINEADPGNCPPSISP